jgi:uncharacterized membrane protein
MAIGPVQLFVLGFPAEGANVTSKIDQAIKDSPWGRGTTKEGEIRLLDLVVIRKDAQGNIDRLRATDLTPEQRKFAGAAVGGLLGMGAGAQSGRPAGRLRGTLAGAKMGAQRGAQDFLLTDMEIQEVMRGIPNNTVVGVFMVEHVWANRLMENVKRAGGTLLAEGIVTPDTLVAIGTELAAAEQAANQSSMS